MAENWPWIAGVMSVMAYAGRKAFHFFQGQNRQAEALENLTIEVREQRKKLDSMVDGPGVDSRVAPVIDTVKTMQHQISQIYDHLLNREEKRDRITDK